MTARNTDPVLQLGEVITTHVRYRDYSPKKVADIVGVPVSLVEDWMAGKEVPDGLRWKKLCTMVNKSLSQYAQLRFDALKAVKDREHKQNMGANEKIGTSLGAKLGQVIPLTQPVPQRPSVKDMVTMVMADSDKEREMPRYEEPEQPDEPEQTGEERLDRSARSKAAINALPAGWKTAAARNERREYARSMWRKDPGLSILDVDKALAEKFGVSVAQYALAEIKTDVLNEVAAERQKAKEDRAAKKAKMAEVDALVDRPDATIPPPPPAPVAVTTASGAMPAALDVEAQLEAAGRLILEAIPNLHRFTLAISDSGEVEVDYEVKRVGKLTFGKKQP